MTTESRSLPFWIFRTLCPLAPRGLRIQVPVGKVTASCGGASWGCGEAEGVQYDDFGTESEVLPPDLGSRFEGFTTISAATPASTRTPPMAAAMILMSFGGLSAVAKDGDAGE
jgi:hypothetical protein